MDQQHQPSEQRYYQKMDDQTRKELEDLETRARVLTGTVLAVIALVATYGLQLVEGTLSRPAAHFYPWLAAVLFFLAGQLIAIIWYRAVKLRLESLIPLIEAEAVTRAREQLISAEGAAGSAVPVEEANET
jgi:hypothetical protein